MASVISFPFLSTKLIWLFTWSCIFVILRASDQKVVVSGVLTKGNADFKPEAVKVAHEKPMPQHDKRPPGGGGKGSNVIQQPRKQ